MYSLFYSPKDPDNIGKIKIKVTNNRYKVVYDKVQNKETLLNYMKTLDQKMPSLILEAFIKKRNLYFSIKGISLNNPEKRGIIEVSIQGIDDLSGKSAFKAEKKFQTGEGVGQFSANMGFAKLLAGNYTFTIVVEDLTTGKVKNHQIKTSFKWDLRKS